MRPNHQRLHKKLLVTPIGVGLRMIMTTGVGVARSQLLESVSIGSKFSVRTLLLDQPTQQLLIITASSMFHILTLN